MRTLKQSFLGRKRGLRIALIAAGLAVYPLAGFWIWKHGASSPFPDAINPITPGMSREAVIAMRGRPAEILHYDGKECLLYEKWYSNVVLRVEFDQTGKVSSAYLDD